MNVTVEMAKGSRSSKYTRGIVWSACVWEGFCKLRSLNVKPVLCLIEAWLVVSLRWGSLHLCGLLGQKRDTEILLWWLSKQWRIQDFPEEGGANPRGGANLLFGQFFPKTAWKWRNFGPEGGGGARPSRPPLRSATAKDSWHRSIRWDDAGNFTDTSYCFEDFVKWGRCNILISTILLYPSVHHRMVWWFRCAPGLRRYQPKMYTGKWWCIRIESFRNGEAFCIESDKLLKHELESV